MSVNLLIIFLGPITPTKVHQGHRHTNTSPSSTTVSLSPVTTSTSSGACVVGIDIPSSPRSPPSANDHTHHHQRATPRRASSMREVREAPPTSQRGLVYPVSGGVAREGGVVDDGTTRRNKPRRSNSLSYHSNEHRSGSSSSNIDLTSSAGTTEHLARNPTHQYPLRETVSLSQLPGGGYVGSGRPGPGPYGGVAVPNQPVGAFGESSLGQATTRSSSVQNLPSRQYAQLQHLQTNSSSSSTHHHHHHHRREKHKIRTSHIQGGLEVLPNYSRDRNKVRN